MPVADEKLVEKLPFDVYAMMLILSFLLLGVAVWLINDDLQTNWFAGQPGRKSSEHITKSNGRPTHTHASIPRVALISRISSAMRNSFFKMSSAS